MSDNQTSECEPASGVFDEPVGWLAKGKPDFKPHFCRTRQDAEHIANSFVTYVKGCTGAEIMPLFAGQAEQFDLALKRCVPPQDPIGVGTSESEPVSANGDLSFDDLPISIIRRCTYPHCNCEIHCETNIPSRHQDERKERT